jgi:hypothetical protein
MLCSLFVHGRLRCASTGISKDVVMTRFRDMQLREAIASQIDLLAQGRPPGAFDVWLSPAGKIYANDRLFAADGAEARRKQEPFISAARGNRGKITDLNVDTANGLCVAQNQTRFSAPTGWSIRQTGCAGSGGNTARSRWNAIVTVR